MLQILDLKAPQQQHLKFSSQVCKRGVVGRCLLRNPEGNFLALGSRSSEVSVFDLQKLELLFSLEDQLSGALTQIEYLFDCYRFIVGGEGPRLNIINSSSQESEKILLVGEGPVNQLQCPAPNQLFVLQDSRRVYHWVWDAYSYELRRVTHIPGYQITHLLLPTSKIWVLVCKQKQVVLFDSQLQKVTQTFKFHLNQITDVLILPKKSLLLTAAKDKLLYFHQLIYKK